MIELHTPEFEKITFQRGVNIFTFTKAEESKLFLEKIQEAFHKRIKSSKLFLKESDRDKEPKDYYYIETSVGAHAQIVKLHDVLIEKVIYDFYHDEKQMKAYYDFQCQYQMFLNQIEIKRPEYNILFHSENFQEKQFLKQLEFDVMKEHEKINASDRLRIYCDTKISMNEKSKEVITVILYPETEIGLFELAEFAKYVSTLSGYIIIVTNTPKYFLNENVCMNMFNKYRLRVNIEDMLREYQLFDAEMTLMDVVQIVEYYISGSTYLMGKRYEELVKSSGINEVDMV